MIAIAQDPGSGWLEYKWPNPQTNRIEPKLTYIERMGDYIVGVRHLEAIAGTGCQ